MDFAEGGIIPADQAANADTPPAWLTRCFYDGLIDTFRCSGWMTRDQEF